MQPSGAQAADKYQQHSLLGAHTHGCHNTATTTHSHIHCIYAVTCDAIRAPVQLCVQATAPCAAEQHHLATRAVPTAATADAGGLRDAR
jgi:hypothetical protein